MGLNAITMNGFFAHSVLFLLPPSPSAWFVAAREDGTTPWVLLYSWMLLAYCCDSVVFVDVLADMVSITHCQSSPCHH